MSGREAFEEKVSGALDALYDGADLLTGEPRRAEALVLGAVVEAAREYPVGRKPDDFRQWILGRLVRGYLDYVDSAGYREARAAAAEWDGRTDPGPEPRVRPDDLVERLAEMEASAPDRLSDAIRGSMRRLPLRERAVLWLVNVMGFGYGEAAAALGIPLGEVRDLLYRARGELQLRLTLLLRESDEGPPAAGRAEEA